MPPRLWRERVADILDAIAAVQTMALLTAMLEQEPEDGGDADTDP